MMPGHERRLADGDDVAERRGAVVLRRHRRRSGDAEDRSIVPADVLRQIRRRHPRVAAIVRAEQSIAAEIDGARVVRREDERAYSSRSGSWFPVAASARCSPFGLPPKPNCAAAPAPRGRASHRLLQVRHRVRAGRPAWTDAVASAGAQIDAVRVAILRLRVEDRPVRLIVLGVEAVAAANPEPVGVEDAVAAARRARSAPAAVVLQAAADVVRLPHVGADRVELPDRHGVHVLPGVTAVVGDVETAVVAEHQVIAVLRIDPDRVMVAVRNALDRVPRFAAVGGLEERRTALVGDLRVASDRFGSGCSTSSDPPGSTGSATSFRRRPSARRRSCSDPVAAEPDRGLRRSHHRRRLRPVVQAAPAFRRR